MENQLEALKLLKEWSIWLACIQSGALVLIAAVVNPRSTFTFSGAGARLTVVFPGLSIICATWVLAATPSIAQRIKPTDNIHKMSIFDSVRIPLWVLTAAQHWFAVIGILVFVVSYAMNE